MPVHRLVRSLSALVVALLASSALVAVTSGTATAACPIGQTCVPPLHSTLTVAAPSAGRITSSPAGIDCPGDCTEADTYSIDDEMTEYTLTPVRNGSGFVPSWTGCDSVTGDHKCVVTNDDDPSVSMSWTDTVDPQVTSLSGVPALVGATTPMTVSATASDNDAVSSVTFYVDGVELVGGTDTTAPFEHTFTLGLLVSGSGSHTVGAQAVDPSGKTSPMVTKPVEIDKDRPIVGLAGPYGAIDTTTATWNFTILDAHPGPSTCRIDTAAPAPCTTSFSKSGVAPGHHTFYLHIEDAAGNVTNAISPFIVRIATPMSATATRPHYGQPARLGVSGMRDDASGTVTFMQGKVLLCLAQVFDGGATCQTEPNLVPGTHTVVASYAGNATISPATRTFRLVIDKIATQVRAHATKKKIHRHKKETLVAKGLPASATGKVVFRKGKHTLCTATVHHGAATCHTKKLSKLGKYKVVAKYVGSAYYLPARKAFSFKVR